MTKILPEPIKKILNKNSTRKEETKEQEKTSKLYVWAIAFILTLPVVFAIGYKKRLKP